MGQELNVNVFWPLWNTCNDGPGALDCLSTQSHNHAPSYPIHTKISWSSFLLHHTKSSRCREYTSFESSKCYLSYLSYFLFWEQCFPIPRSSQNEVPFQYIHFIILGNKRIIKEWSSNNWKLNYMYYDHFFKIKDLFHF